MNLKLFPEEKKLDELTAPFQYEFCLEVLKSLSVQHGLTVHIPEDFSFTGIEDKSLILSKSGFKRNGYVFSPQASREGEEGEGEATNRAADLTAPVLEGFTKINLDKVSINLMWLNKKIDKSSRYIVDMIEEQPFEVYGVEHIVKWMLLNPMSHVIYWYDASKNSPEQVAATLNIVQKKIQQLKLENFDIDIKNFEIHAIQELDYVSVDTFGKQIFSTQDDNREIIYIKSNLARVMAAIETLMKNKNDAYIHADWTVNPHSIAKIYPHGFHDSGFMAVECLSVGTPWENSYMIFTKGKRNLTLVFSRFLDLLLEKVAHPVASQSWMAPEGYLLNPPGAKMNQRIPKNSNAIFSMTMGSAVMLYDDSVLDESYIESLEDDTLLNFFRIGMDGPKDERAIVKTVTLTRNSGHDTKVNLSPSLPLDELLESLAP